MATWKDVATLLSRGEKVSFLLDAQARAVLDEGITVDAGAASACADEGGWVRCGAELLKLQSASPAPPSLLRAMPFLLVLPPAGMDDCGVGPIIIDSACVLDGCVAAEFESVDALGVERDHPLPFDRLLCTALSGATRGQLSSRALRELGNAPPLSTGTLDAEAVQLLCAAPPTVLEALLAALAACEGLAAECAPQFARTLLHAVLPHLAAAARMHAASDPRLSPDARAGPPPFPPALRSLLRRVLGVSGSLVLDAGDFERFIGMSEASDGDLERTGIGMCAAEIFLEHATFGSVECCKEKVIIL
jgi:hypothetical protein